MSKIIEQLKNDPLMPLRHSAEHVLHLAMQELYPSLKKVMGPPIEDGFYFDFDLQGEIEAPRGDFDFDLKREGKAPSGNFDFDLDERISIEDFPKIEARMQEIIDADLPIERHESSLEEAKEIFKDNPYKLDWLKEIEERGEDVTLYSLGEEGSEHYDLDLCTGPHVKSTGEIKAFKLLSVAGAYYKGDEKNKMLQRIYGTAFDSQEKLANYLEMLEEAKKRDHRKIGKELELFTINEDVGQGLILWLPKGTILREEIEKLGKETEAKYGYQRVTTPHIGKEKLYLTSGHLPYYAQDMWPPMEYEGEKYYVKPMNCPHMHMIYKFKIRSYKELPIRFAEFGTVYRHEDGGTLMGLLRVRGHTTNDAHIYCTEEQVVDELVSVVELHTYYYDLFGIKDYYVELALPDFIKKKDKYFDDPQAWEKSIQLLREAAKKSMIEVIEKEGSAAFYGPKFDFNIKSSIGREFGASTNQLDFGSGKRFNLTYIANDGSEKVIPYIVHRAPLGSHERFIGLLIEHYGGAFPVWLSPVQVKVIPIADKHVEYAHKAGKNLKDKNLRVEVDDRNETMQAKIRDAQLQKIPYMLIVGDREAEKDEVSVRLRSGKDLGSKSMEEVVDKINDIYLTKSLKLW